MTTIARRPYSFSYLTANGQLLDIPFTGARMSHGFDQNIATAEFNVPFLTRKLTMGTWVAVVLVADAAINPFFQGRIVGYDFRNWPKSVTVRLAGPLSIADKYEPEDPIALGTYTDIAAINLILATCGITARSILGRGEYLFDASDDPMQRDDQRWTWMPGTSALAFIQSIDELSRGYRTFDSPTGQVLRRRISTTPTATPAKILTGGVDIAEGSSVDWDTVRNGSNGITVLGRMLPDGVQVSAGADASPDVGSGFLTVNNPRIVDTTQAQAVADWFALEVDRPIIRVTIVTPRGDVFQPGTTIGLADTDRLASNKLLWLQAVSCGIDGSGRFQQTLTCISEILLDSPGLGVPGQEYHPGEALNPTPAGPGDVNYAPDPVADFVFEAIDHEVTDTNDEFWIVVVRAVAWSPGGAITAYAWSTDTTTVPETGDTERWVVKITDIATVITLEVTDEATNTASISRACNDALALAVTLDRKIYVAGDTLAVAYDGSGVGGWNTQTLTTAVVGNGPIWGSGGDVAASNDDLATAPESVTVFSGGETVTSVFVETDVSASNAWAGGSAGHVARSTDGASTWTTVGQPSTNDILRIIASRYNSGEVLVLDDAGDVYQSLDYGITWGLIASHSGAVDLCQSNFRNWVCGSFGVAVMEDPTALATWPGSTPNVVAITAHIREDRLYALANDGTTYYLDPAGGLAMVAGASLPAGTAQVRGMMRDGALVDMLYIAAGDRLYKSHDGLRTTAGYTQIYGGAATMPGYGDYPLSFTPPAAGESLWFFWSDE